MKHARIKPDKQSLSLLAKITHWREHKEFCSTQSLSVQELLKHSKMDYIFFPNLLWFMVNLIFLITAYIPSSFLDLIWFSASNSLPRWTIKLVLEKTHHLHVLILNFTEPPLSVFSRLLHEYPCIYIGKWEGLNKRCVYTVGQLRLLQSFWDCCLPNGTCTLVIFPADIAATQPPEEEHSKYLTATGVR